MNTKDWPYTHLNSVVPKMWPALAEKIAREIAKLEDDIEVMESYVNAQKAA